MGLDQYAYVARKKGEREEFFDQDGLKFENGDWVTPPGGLQEPRELAYWRKHPNLQGWMEALWHSKGCPGVPEEDLRDFDFNGVELELTFEDILKLENDINNGTVAQLQTSGFFFGDPSDDYYKEHDLEFVKKAKAELFCGLKVFYNSSW